MLTTRGDSTTLELRSPRSAGRRLRAPTEAGRAPPRGESSPGARKGAPRAPLSCSAARCPSTRTSRRCRTLVALAPPDATAMASRATFTSRGHWRSYGGSLGAASQKASMSSRGSSCPLSPLPEESVARRRRDPSAATITPPHDGNSGFSGHAFRRHSTNARGKSAARATYGMRASRWPSTRRSALGPEPRARFAAASTLPRSLSS